MTYDSIQIGLKGIEAEQQGNLSEPVLVVHIAHDERCWVNRDKKERTESGRD